MSELYLYFTAFLSKWWAVVSAFALFAIEPIVEAYWPWGHKQLVKHGLERLSKTTRTKIEIAIIAGAFFYAGFAAWSEEHEARLKIEMISGNSSGSWQLTAEQRAKLSSGCG